MADAVYDQFAAFYDEFVSSEFYMEFLLPLVWELIPPVRGRRVCDIACGQGVVARGLAKRGARVVGVDISERLLELAEKYERAQPLGIEYIHDDAQILGKMSGGFDGAVCNMGLIDIPDADAVFHATHRILSPGGWLAFSITHPCWEAPYARWSNDDGVPVRIVSRYTTEGFWRARHNPDGIRYRVGSWHRTISTYVNGLADAGFRIERMIEPPSTDRRLDEVPGNAEMPSILLVRARTI